MPAIQDDKPTTRKKRQPRKIRFHERVQFKTIRHVSEFSDDEIKNGWYDKDDFNRMSDNVSDIAILVADGETILDGEELCTRGLEHIVEEELADYRAEKMINSIDAVLDEQEEQWDEGKEEPELIAELYAEYAKPLLKEAHLIGLKDAEQGYKDWNDLLDEKQYKKFATKGNTFPLYVGVNDDVKPEKTGKAKKTKKPIKADDLSHGQSEIRSTKQTVPSSNTSNTVGKREKVGTTKTKVKKNKVKKSDDLPLEEQTCRNKTLKEHVPVSSNESNTVSKTEKGGKSLMTEKKKKVKRRSSQQDEGVEKAKNATPTTCNVSSSCTDESESSLSVQSSTSSQSSPISSMHLLKNQGSISSINSCALKDLSMGSTSEEFDTIVETEEKKSVKGKGFSSVSTKSDTKPKQSLQNNGKSKSVRTDTSTSQKKQRKTQPRRSAMDRKYGTELSPFVFRRDGSLAFRKPDVEKLKKEQKAKRKSDIKGSLTKFLHSDDDEEDILAGILSSTGK